MLQTFGIFYADTQQVLGTYTSSNGPQISTYTGDREVIHADVPSWVDPTKCFLISIAGIWHAVTNVEYAIANAVSFGERILIKFAAENVMLGITQAGKTQQVQTVLAPVIACLQTGSLYNAISQVEAINPGDYDSTFITAARLLVFVNLIQTYLGIALSTSIP